MAAAVPNDGIAEILSMSDLVADAKHRSETADPASATAEVFHGLYAGLTTGRSESLRQVASGKTELYLGGFLYGRLIAHLLDERGHIDDKLGTLAFRYVAPLAGLLARGELDKMSAERLVSAHTSRCIRVTLEGRSISEAEESSMFRWLADEFDVPTTPDLLRRYREMRQRRIVRYTEQDLADLIREAERESAAAEPSSKVAEAWRGKLAGLTTDRPALLRAPGYEMSEVYRAGFLRGHLESRIVRERGSIRKRLGATCSVYAWVLAKLEHEPWFGERSAKTALKAHTIACINAARKKRFMRKEEELLMFHWLVEQLGVPITPQLVASYDKTRQRRLERAE